MPSWSIHLTIAKKINKKLKLDKDLFYYGNLIPDVDKNTNIPRYYAHYYDSIPFPNCPSENMINMDLFLNKYKNKFSNPLVLGYYCHILTDQYYNNIVYSRCWVQDDKNEVIGIKLKNGKIINIDLEDKNKLKKKYKHSDFELYGRYLFNSDNWDFNFDYKKILKSVKDADIDFLNEELIKHRIEYLKDKFYDFNKLSVFERLFKHRYKLFTKEELDNMLDDCLLYIMKELRKADIKL